MIITTGRVVSLTYALRDRRGEIFERADAPISYLHGSGQDLFDKIKWALEGRSAGDWAEVKPSPAESFG